MAERKERQGRGCFFYGCLTMILVFIGVMAGIYFGTRQAFKYAVGTYTASAPAQLPALELTPAEQRALADSIRQQVTAAANGGGPLVLGEKELNVLLAESPELAPYKKQIYLQPEGDQLKAHLSIPLDQFKLWTALTKRLLARSLSNRYFNGVAVLNAGVTNGGLNISVKDLIVGGKSMPSDFTGRMEGRNLTSESNKNPEIRKLLERIERLEIRDGKIHIYFKPGTVPLRARAPVPGSVGPPA